MKGASCSRDHLRGIFTGIVTQIFQQYFFDRRKRFVAMGRQRETLVPRLFSLKLLMSRSKHDRRLLVRLTKFSTFYHRARKFIVRPGEHFYRRWKSIFRFFYVLFLQRWDTVYRWIENTRFHKMIFFRVSYPFFISIYFEKSFHRLASYWVHLYIYFLSKFDFILRYRDIQFLL